MRLQKMVFKAGNIGLLVLVVFFLLRIHPSTSSPLENENLMALGERLDQLQLRVFSLEAENEVLKNRVDSLQIKVDHLEVKDAENEAKIRKQEGEITQLKEKIVAKLESIPFHNELVTNLRPSKKMSSIYRKESSSGDSSTRAVVPASCRELSLIGHSLDGLYLVQNQDTNKIETVYCDFGTSISQDFKGNVDIKTKNAHFYVQRRNSFTGYMEVIPFQSAHVNEGDAFDLESGIFTAPVPGIYHFQFSGVKSALEKSLSIYLQVNGAVVGLAFTAPATNATGSNDVVSLNSSLRLAKGDIVNVYMYGPGTIVDDGRYWTHFSGWLVEEDLM